MNNKLGITSVEELAEVEERLGKLRARELFDSGRLATIPVGTADSLTEIHRVLFGDVYDFAGKFRTVNIYKGELRFAPVEGLENAVKFAAIMPQDTFDEIIEKFIQMNIAHPFREGNGRAMRLWLDVIIAAKLEMLVDWSAVDKKTYQLVMERCVTDGAAVADLIRSALTKKVGRSMFLRAIDGSFALEGYTKYRAELL
ncbi:MAG: Fic family protein [Clostridiales bacterium]|nr:Fic family protein [Clostridiales bacterium]